MQTMTTEGSWRFTFEGGHFIEVECLTRPYGSKNVPVPFGFRAGDLEMFARGWVACREHV